MSEQSIPLQEKKPMFDYRNKRGQYVYLAGPFFNEAQLALMGEIEAALEKAGIEFFSPRLECLCPPNADEETRKATVAANIGAIENCNFLIAVLDYAMEPGCNVFLDTHKRTIKLDIPDSGTVFEMGFAHCMGIKIIGIRKADSPLNLMLSQTCEAIFGSIGDLMLSAPSTSGDWKKLIKGQGKKISEII